MDHSKEPICVRIARLNTQITGKLQKRSINKENLLDAFNVLYDECNSDCMKKHDRNVSTFVNKYRGLVTDLKSLRVNIFDFDIKQVIGRGHFGEVHVVTEKQTGNVYAMKTIKKSLCLEQKALSFEDERNIMAFSCSPWITNLQYSFQDNSNLYFIMEYHPGGDLLGLLHRQGGTIPESAAGFYLSEVILALKDLHAMGYVHRDVKPDNILLDRCGHLKLADFGSSARINSNGFVTDAFPVGTPDYVAPEVLQSVDGKKKTNYGISCDYWSLGILGYELTIGNTPFTGDNSTVIYSKIMNFSKHLKFPPEVVLSQAYVTLIKGLLCDANSRLNYEQITNHPMFRSVDFNSLTEQVPPYVPKIVSGDDTSNFADVQPKKSQPNIENFKTKTQFSGRNLPFVGFTYTHYVENYLPKVAVKNEQAEDMRKELNSLRKKLIEKEDVTREKENLERKLEEKDRKLETFEGLREMLERDLANSISDATALKRTLELERKDRSELERRALDLIKSAKLKWETSERQAIEALKSELEIHKDKIQELSDANTTLQQQLERALLLENKQKISFEKVENFNRRSVVGLESRLEKMTSESQAQISGLQVRYLEEKHKNCCLENELTQLKTNETGLKTSLAQYEQDCYVLKEKLRAAENLAKDFQLKISNLTNDCKAISDYKSEIDSLKQKLCRTEADNRLVEQLEQALRANSQEKEALQKQIEDLTVDLDFSKLSTESTLQEQKEEYEARLKKFEDQLNRCVDDKKDLEVRLETTQASTQNYKVKIQSLEELLVRLESGVTKLEGEKERENVLKEQVERLEQQLVQVHESAAVDKQELTKLKTKFWRLEKDLSNAEIDKRIFDRELKESRGLLKQQAQEIESLKVKMDENRQIHEKALLELNNLNENLATEICKLQEFNRHLQGQVREDKEKSDNEKSLIDEIKREVYEKNNEIVALVRIIEQQKVENVGNCNKLEQCESEKIHLQIRLENCLKEQSILENQLENSSRDLFNTQLNLEALREACTLLEGQLIEYESIHFNLQAKEVVLNANSEKLIQELSQIKQEVQEARKLANEEKTLKNKAEINCKRLLEDIDCLKNECSSYKNQCIEFKMYAGTLSEELHASEEKLGDAKVTVKSYERQISDLISENRIVKEESSGHLTHLTKVKGSNLKLNQELNELKAQNSSLVEKIGELENILTEKLNFHKEFEMKSNSTIAQQSKLIDYLQSKLEEHKKKRTLADKLFGSKKENQPPVLEGLYQKERDNNRNLHQEIVRLKSQNEPLSPVTKLAVEKLVKSPVKNNDQNSRMHHNIPHRFESKLCTTKTNCSQCSNQILLGRTASVCRECHVTVHPRCANSAPRTCGLPTAYAKHYSNSLTKLAPEEKPEVSSIETWIKIYENGWEKRFAVLTPTMIKVYSHEPSSNMVPIDTFDLKTGRGKVVLEPLQSEITAPIASSDLPFIIKVEVAPETTCWPPQSFVFMTLSTQDRDNWYKVLQSMFHGTKYTGNLIARLEEDGLEVNCLFELSFALLVGTDRGLYSYHDDSFVHIAGPLNVHQISVHAGLNIAVMIVDSRRVLISCDLNHLEGLSQCASCSSPTLKFNLIGNLDGFHMFKLSDGGILCGGMSKRLVIMTLKGKEFVPIRCLDTAEPTSCVLFTEHSIIVGVNKFYEIDLKSFQAEEFLDVSDKNLSQAVQCYKMGSFPLDIIQVSKDPIEFLLCFNEFAIFVDEYGRCSRTTDIKWSRVPQAFHFHKSCLFIVQFTAVEIIKITSQQGSVESLCDFDSLKINFDKPKYLGCNKKGIFVNVGKEIRYLDGSNLADDCSSINSEVRNDDDQFSFTSSMVQSLDGDFSDNSSDIAPGGKKVTFSTETEL